MRRFRRVTPWRARVGLVGARPDPTLPTPPRSTPFEPAHDQGPPFDGTAAGRDSHELCPVRAPVCAQPGDPILLDSQDPGAQNLRPRWGDPEQSRDRRRRVSPEVLHRFLPGGMSVCPRQGPASSHQGVGQVTTHCSGASIPRRRPAVPELATAVTCRQLMGRGGEGDQVA